MVDTVSPLQAWSFELSCPALASISFQTERGGVQCNMREGGRGKRKPYPKQAPADVGCQAQMKNPTGCGTVAGCPPARRRLPGTAAVLLRLEREILCGPLRVLPSPPAQGNAQEGDELVHSSPVSSDQPSLLAGRACSWPSPRVLVTSLPYGIRLMGESSWAFAWHLSRAGLSISRLLFLSGHNRS